MGRLIREPLLHFVVLGALLFGLYGWAHRDALETPKRIVVSRGEVQTLQVQFERVRQRSPTRQELRALIDNWVREEILYREGLAMGLDRDDPVVRRRVAQKVAFIIESTESTEPTTQELQTWFDAHASTYTVEPIYSLRQIYLDPRRHGERLDADIAAAGRALQRSAFVPGDSTMLPATLHDARSSEIARTFGEEFADRLKSLPVGSWQGPVRSSYGVHLVQLTVRQDGRNATLDEVRNQVERDLLQARTAAANDTIYNTLRANYAVRIEDDVIAADPAG